MNKEHRQWIFGLIVVLILPSLVSAQVFFRDLSLGDSGEDVRALQQVLNARPGTQVAQSGPGSLGEETDYFGPRTLGAVVRYQNLHAAEILAPLGLVSGTGYVGASTRTALSSESGSAFTAPVSPVSGSQSQSVNTALASFDRTIAAFQAPPIGSTTFPTGPSEEPSQQSSSQQGSQKGFGGTETPGGGNISNFMNPTAILMCALISGLTFIPPDVCIVYYNVVFEDIVESIGLDALDPTQSDINKKIEGYVKDLLTKGCSPF